MRAVLVVPILLLAACTSNPLSNPASLNPLAHPPWEAFVQAGPHAEKDVDYETLNGATIAEAQPQELVPDSDIAVGKVDQATQSEEQPTVKGAILIKAVAVLPVTGAGSPGNDELTAAMRNVLGDAGLPVISAPRKDALNIRGKVAILKRDANTQTVTIVWLVTTPKGKAVGDVRQANEIPKGSLASGWGDTAEVVAQAAAEGIAKLVQNYR